MKNIIILVLYTLLTCLSSTNAQTIPNSSFENWTNMGSYNNLDSWSTLNDMTSPMSIYTCVKGTPGQVGTAYLKLTSKNVTGMGVVPGIAVCGTMDMVTMQPNSGFAFTERPTSLTGKWQYMAYGADQGFLATMLTKWNSISMMRDTIAIAYHPLIGMAMSWVNFTIPLTYLSGNDPDSCMIILSASQANGATAAVNSYLYVDGLNFSGLVANIINTNPNHKLIIYPNPTTDFLNLDFSTLKSNPLAIKIVDILGNEVKSIDVINANNNTKINISDLPNGKYILKVSTAETNICNSFIKQ